MDHNDQETILSKLTKSEQPLVVVSPKGTFDDLAAGLALYLSIKNLGKKSSIYANTPTIGEARRLYGVGEIGNIVNQKNLVITVQNAVKSVDKVSYFLDRDNRLNITVHALPGGPGVLKEDVSFDNLPVLADIVFAIGFESKMELEQIITPEQLNNPNVLTIGINKTPVSQKIAQINIIDSGSMSMCETVTEIIQKLALPVNEDIAYNLFAGISFASDNFSPAKSTQRGFHLAGWLVKFGAGRSSMATFSGNDSRFSKSQTFAPQMTSSQSMAAKNVMITKVDNNLAQDQAKSQENFPPQDHKASSNFPKKTSESNKDWLRPPKIYKGSKSFDRES